MKKKLYTAIGLMSGTSMDGVDVSMIKSDGFNQFTNIFDEYFKYNESLYRELIKLRNLIINVNDLKQAANMKTFGCAIKTNITFDLFFI